jgi:hypothetical protein
MNQSLAWFATASSTDACDYIGKGIAEFRRLNKVEAEQRQLKKQQIEIHSASGRISEADKAAYDAANRQFEERNKSNADYDDALVVLAVLGSRLVGLNVVNHHEINSANDAVRQAFQGVGGSKYFERYERLDKSVQIGVICGLAFCAECYPMHIWRGFGSTLMGNYNWATHYVDNQTWTYLDQSVSFLKSSHRNFTLFKSLPEGMERMKPWIRKDEKEHNAIAWKAAKKDRKALEKAKKDFNKRVEKKGFPQPSDKSFTISSWSIPYATWDSQFSINNEGHNWANVLQQQMDPGRLFHAFVIGGHLNLREEEALIIPAGPAECLVRWLEGLEGMTFKLIPTSKLDLKKVGLKSSTLKLMQTQQGKDAFAVRDDAAVKRKQAKASERPAAAIPHPPILVRSLTRVPVPATASVPQSPVAETPVSPASEVSPDHSLNRSPPPSYVQPGESKEFASPIPSEIPPMPYMVPNTTIPPMPTMPGDKRMSMPYMSPPVKLGSLGPSSDRRASMGMDTIYKTPEVTTVQIEAIHEVPA